MGSHRRSPTDEHGRVRFPSAVRAPKAARSRPTASHTAAETPAHRTLRLETSTTSPPSAFGLRVSKTPAYQT